MTDLINQLYDIATNDEFSPDQRKSLMKLAFDDAGMMLWAQPDGTLRSAMVEVPSLTLNIDETLGRTLTKERTPNGIRFGISTFSPNE